MKNQKSQNPQRTALKRLSQQLRKQLAAGTLPESLQGCQTINEALQRICSLQTGQNNWNSYKSWRERGYHVKKGEKGFPIWSKPAEDQTQNEATAGEDQPQKLSYWAKFRVAYIFHFGQVSKMDEAPTPKTSITRAFSPAEYEALDEKPIEQLILF